MTATFGLLYVFNRYQQTVGVDPYFEGIAPSRSLSLAGAIRILRKQGIIGGAWVADILRNGAFSNNSCKTRSFLVYISS